MASDDISFTNGSARWLHDQDAMGFSATASGENVEFVITNEALAALIGPSAGHLSEIAAIDAFAEFQLDIIEIARIEWRKRQGEQPIVLREADVEVR